MTYHTKPHEDAGTLVIEAGEAEGIYIVFYQWMNCVITAVAKSTVTHNADRKNITRLSATKKWNR